MTERSLEPQLSAILVVGRMRERGQKVLDALCAQTIANRMEIVVVDMAPNNSRLLAAPEVAVVYVKAPEFGTYVRARIRGIETARAAVVAFIEDHCFPEPGWAAALTETHKGPWAAVCYGFLNANPENYVARSSMISDYGYWTHPAPTGPSYCLTSNNISYKRAVLMEFRDELEVLLAPDQVMFEVLRRHGYGMYIEGRALAAHQNFTRLSMLFKTNFAYCRLYACHRADAHRLRTAQRIFNGVTALTLSPWLRLAHLFRGLRGRGLWRQTFLALPIMLASFLCCSVGASIGYLFGSGRAESDLTYFDFDVEKAP